MNQALSEPIDVSAVGIIAGELRCSVSSVRRFATELEIEPAMFINNIPHYTRGDIDRIAGLLRDCSNTGKRER